MPGIGNQGSGIGGRGASLGVALLAAADAIARMRSGASLERALAAVATERQLGVTERAAAQDLSFTDLAQAAAFLKRIDKLRREVEQEGNQQKLKQVRELALHNKQEAQLVAGSKIVTAQDRLVAKEIAEWIRVWLQQPDLFDDWLSLRQRSPEYRRKF